MDAEIRSHVGMSNAKCQMSNVECRMRNDERGAVFPGVLGVLVVNSLLEKHDASEGGVLTP